MAEINRQAEFIHCFAAEHLKSEKEGTRPAGFHDDLPVPLIISPVFPLLSKLGHDPINHRSDNDRQRPVQSVGTD